MLSRAREIWHRVDNQEFAGHSAVWRGTICNMCWASPAWDTRSIFSRIAMITPRATIPLQIPCKLIPAMDLYSLRTHLQLLDFLTTGPTMTLMPDSGLDQRHIEPSKSALAPTCS